MSNKKFHILAIIILLLLIAACTRSLSDPFPTGIVIDLDKSPTATTRLPELTSTSPAETPPSELPTGTATAVPPTSTPPPLTPVSTPAIQPPVPTPFPTYVSGTLGSVWNLADIRYGIHADRLRVVLEMVDNRNTFPFHEIKEVDNASVPFPTGHDPSWGKARIDLVISDLYAYNAPILAQLPLIPPENPVVTRIGQYPTFDDALLGFSIGLKTPAVFKIYELTNPVRIVIDVLFPNPGSSNEPKDDMVAWDQFTNPNYAVTLMYPAHWSVDPGSSTLEYGDTRFTGIDGFFMINAGDSESLDTFTSNEATHKLKPYGSLPSIVKLTIDGQEARMILPSADQSMPDQAALVVQYPQPVHMGEHSYPFFVLYANKKYIQSIANSVRFVTSP
jgi:hypothetical protein